jgi:hypothetical protein
MQSIELSHGQVAIVDDRDYAWLMNGPKWSCDAKGYAVRHVRMADGTRKTEKMHRIIVGLKRGDPDVDHEDRDTLNNRRYNLRIGSKHQNGANRIKSRHYGGKPTRSKFKGVTVTDGEWRANIRVNGKLKNLGNFESEEAAAAAYDAAAEREFGSFARLNRAGN